MLNSSEVLVYNILDNHLMKFNSLQLSQYRNYTQQRLDFNSGVNVFLGQNGQGKTNLMESMFLMIRGQSFRPAKFESYILKGKSEAFLRASVEANDLTHNLELALKENKKKYSLNKKNTSLARISNLFPCVLFSPESLASVKEGPEQRRQLVDEVLANQGFSQLISDYKRALKQRNRLLMQNKKADEPMVGFQQMLDSLDVSFLKLATQLTAKRVYALRELITDFQEIFREILSKNVDISVDYLVSGDNSLQDNESQIYQKLSQRREELLKAEISSGTSLIGPHKHDICFLVNQEDGRFYCSQGQQRALILAFKMAQIQHHKTKKGFYPILMLDDVLSELDNEKRYHLVNFLKTIDSQIFITTTDLNFKFPFQETDLNIYTIEDGVASVFSN